MSNTKNRHAFMIVAYNLPDYVDSQIIRYGGGTSDRTNIYVHIDTKSKDCYRELVNKYKTCSNVKFYSQESLHWGGSQIIEVERLLLREALIDKDNFYFHLLSNTEFLCRPLSELIDFFDDPQNQNKEYIECAPIEEVWGQNAIKRRFYSWNIHDIIDTRRWHLGLVNRYFGMLQWYLHIRRRPFPFKRVYAGSSWWTLSKDGADILLRAFDNKKLSDRFRFVYAPDEIFPSIVIGNSDLKIVSDYCLRNRDANTAGIPCFRYIPWWKKGSRSLHPLTLDEGDYSLIKKSGAFFCRKIDVVHSKILIEKILADEDTFISLK